MAGRSMRLWNRNFDRFAVGVEGFHFWQYPCVHCVPDRIELFSNGRIGRRTPVMALLERGGDEL